MTRHRPEIYTPSPIETWVTMFKSVYTGEEYAAIRSCAIDFITSDTIEGLVQLRNYADTRTLWREIMALVRHRRRNLLHPKFWFYALLTLLTPAFLLSRLNDAYKRHILARTLDVPNPAARLIGTT